MTHPPLISVIVVAWNAGEWLRHCLDALDAQTFREFETIVVDNGATDGCWRAAEGRPGVRLIHAGANLGFAAGNNLAAREAAGTWLALLNPDAIAAPDWLEKLAAATRRHPGATMFGSLQVDHADPSRLDGCGDVYHVSGLAWRGGYGRPEAERPRADAEVFAPCAAAALYRRDAFLAAGGFDEDWFCYFEDVDLGFRLRLMGGRAVQVADAVVRHVGSASTGRRSAFAVYHGTRNRLWTFAKDMPLPALVLFAPLHLAMSLLMLAKAVPQGVLGPTLRGLGDGVKGLPRVLAKRRRVARGGSALGAMAWSPLAALGRRPVARPVTYREEGR